MRRLFLMLGACLSLVVAGLGCGSKNEGCEELGKAICTKRIECSAFAAKVDGPNFEVCKTLVAADCELSTKVPDGQWTQDAARACAQNYPALSCDDALTGNIPMLCRPPGNRPVGAACGDGFQCQSLLCNRTSSTACGTCVALPKLGEACTSACDFGSQCSRGVCSPYRALGEACDADFECLPSLSCMTGLCKAPMLGGACGAEWECSFDALQYCDSGTLSCQPFPIAFSKIGESCGNGSDQIVLCPRDAYCRTMGSQAFGICTALPVEGQACAITGSGVNVRQLCRSPYTCINGSCAIFDRGSCN